MLERQFPAGHDGHGRPRRRRHGAHRRRRRGRRSGRAVDSVRASTSGRAGGSRCRSGGGRRSLDAPPARADVSGASAWAPGDARSRARRQTRLHLRRSAGTSEARWLGRCPDCGAWNSLRRGDRHGAGRAARRARARRRARRGRRRRAPPRRPRRRHLVRDRPLHVGHRRARPRARRRHRARLAGAGRRRARHRQEHAAAAGRSTRRRPTAAGRCSSAARSRRPRCKMRAERICRRARRASPCWPRRDLESVIAAVDDDAPGAASSSTRSRRSTADELTVGAGQRQPGARGDRSLPAPRQGDAARAVFLVGHVTKDGRHRRTARARAHGRHACCSSRATASLLPRPARRQEPLRLDQRDRRLRDERRRPASASPTPRASSSPSGAPPPAPACTSPSRARAASSSRCRLWSARRELALPRRVAIGFDRNRLAMIVAVLSRHAGCALANARHFC